MSKYKMISPKVPNVPWQERPAELNGAPVWRYKENPIIGRNPVKGVARIFNSAVMPYGDEFIGVFRGEQTNGFRISIWEEARMPSTDTPPSPHGRALNAHPFTDFHAFSSPICAFSMA